MIFFLCISVFSQKDSFFAEDKAKHFLVCFFTSAALTYNMQKKSFNQNRSKTVGFTAALSLGIIKEIYDKSYKKTSFSYKDLIFDVLGATAGTCLYGEPHIW